MLTADDLRPHLSDARLLVINSPQNPSGTAISRESMQAICEAIVTENRRRNETGERPLFLLYDMVYWQLTLDGVEHVTPVGCVPEMSRYTVMVDAISKSWCATGMRVGWAVGPPWLLAPMRALVGHMGAWASRAAQLATAASLAASEDAVIGPWMDTYRNKVAGRQVRIYERLRALQAAGLPVEPVQPEGALYVTARFPIHGRTAGGRLIESDEDIRSVLLHQAGTAVVPFISFGYPEGTGWMRFSIGAVTDRDIDLALDQIEALLRALDP
jgi:aspartate aminotransferase